MSKIDKLIAKHCPKGVPFFPLGDVAEFQNGCAFKPSDWGKEGKPIIRIQNLTNTSKSINRTLLEVDPKYHVERGDLLISWSATIGVFIWDGEPALLNQHIFLVKPNERILKKYLYFLGLKVKENIEQLVHGIAMTHITKGKFLDIKIPVPPVAVQKEIVKILDSYTECAAELVAQLKAEITARVQEYSYHRNALLGFDPSAIKNHPLKNLINKHCPQGVRFFELGEVFENVTGTIIPEDIDDKSMKYVGLEHIEKETGVLVSNFNGSIKDVKSSKNKFRKGDILYGKLRPNLNKVIVANFDGVCSTDILVLRGGSTTLPNFYHGIFLSKKFNKEVMDKIPKAQQLPRTKFNLIKTIKIPVPPVAVQKEIVKILDSYTECEAELVAQLEAEITARRSQYEYCRNKLLTFEESYGV